MRGKVSFSLVHADPVGITPAYAGKSLKYAKEEHGIEDHPRVCGEKFPGWELQKCVVGSPPRMRGKERYFVWQEDGTGITPAYAGKRPAMRIAG